MMYFQELGVDITGLPVYVGDFVCYPYHDRPRKINSALAVAVLPRATLKSITVVRWDTRESRAKVSYVPHPLGDVFVLDPSDIDVVDMLEEAAPFDYPRGYIHRPEGYEVGLVADLVEEYGVRTSSRMLGMPVRVLYDICHQRIIPASDDLRMLNTKAGRILS